MRLAHRIVLIPTLLLALTAGAQETSTADTSTTAATTTATTTSTTTAPENSSETAEPSASSYELRSRFATLVRQNPPELATILSLEPALLANDAFLTQYPDLAKFVAKYPEIRQHPTFYLGEFRQPRSQRGIVSDVLDMIGVGFILLLIASAGSWLIRTVVEHRRWSRLARTQTEVHTKLLDRFGTSAEVLEYMRTPAGTKFLESAPIPVRTAESRESAPIARVMWSIQFGVIVAAAAIGMLLVSGRLARENAEGLFAMGVVALAIGLGFVASAAVSLFVSRRLGLWQLPQNPSDQAS